MDFIINTNQEWQRQWWSNKFGIQTEQLLAAIARVGPVARNVRADLFGSATSPAFTKLSANAANLANQQAV